MNIYLLQISVIGAVLGLVFFFLFAVIAFIAFILLKKTFTMAFRMVIVAVILLIALVGGTAFLMFSSGIIGSAPKNTAPTRSPR